METPIWTPSPERINKSNMFHFIEHINKTFDFSFKDYQELYQWSIDYSDLFWIELAKFCNVKFFKSANEIEINPEQMSSAKWFPDAALNFAENLLKRNDAHSAFIATNELGQRREISYSQLSKTVAQLANALENDGIKIGDRVAGYLPNIPETMMAALSTISIGAIWSSCSVDFGSHAIIDRFQQIAPKVIFIVDGYQYNGKTFSTLEKWQEIQTQLPSIKTVVVIPYLENNPDISKIKNAVLFNDFIKDTAITYQFKQLPFNHPIYILYSSGTTGAPKCIVHGAGGTLLQHLKELVLHTNLKQEDNIFYYTSCGWMMWNWFLSSLAVGATLILYDGSPLYADNEILLNLIDQEKISIFGTSAKYLASLEKANLKPINTHSLKSLQTILSTGSPLIAEQYDYVYQQIKLDVQLSSISGGTDIVSCFGLGNPMLPVYRGELQSIGLGMKVEIYDENGESVENEKGELVCTAPFPSMPIYFWNDPDGKKYHKAYFEKFPNVWYHGDYAKITIHHGLIIYGRSDAVLNPGGIRVGTAEIYREVEKFPEIVESIVVGREINNDIQILLFVRLQTNQKLSNELVNKLKNAIKLNVSPHHVPAQILQVADIPRTISGKISELAVRDIVNGHEVNNKDALANPEALEYFKCK